MTTKTTVPIRETEDGYEPDYDGRRYTKAEYDFDSGQVSIVIPE